MKNWKLHHAVAAMAFLLVIFVASSAMAHLMPAGKGTLNVVGSKVYVVLSLPVSGFYDDSVHKSRISSTALEQEQDSLRDRVRHGIQISSDGVRAELTQILLSLPSGEGHDGAGDEDLMVMIVARFNSPPDTVALASDLWTEGKGGLVIKATVSEGSKTLQSEMGELSASDPEFLFFDDLREVRTTKAKSGFLQTLGGRVPLLLLGLLVLLVGALLLLLNNERRRRAKVVALMRL